MLNTTNYLPNLVTKGGSERVPQVPHPCSC